MRAAYARTADEGPHLMTEGNSRFVINKAKGGQYYFFLRAGNGQVLVTSETYVRKADAENGIRAVKEVAPNAPIIDITTT